MFINNAGITITFIIITLCQQQPCDHQHPSNIHVKTNSAKQVNTRAALAGEELVRFRSRVRSKTPNGSVVILKSSSLSTRLRYIWCGETIWRRGRECARQIKKKEKDGSTYIHHFWVCNLFTWIFPGCGFFSPVAPLSKLLKIFAVRAISLKAFVNSSR